MYLQLLFIAVAIGEPHPTVCVKANFLRGKVHTLVAETHRARGLTLTMSA